MRISDWSSDVCSSDLFDDPGIAMKNWQRTPGNANDTGVNFGLDSDDPTAGTGALVAWDAKTQKEVWRVKIDSFWNGGTMATAGNLVFQGHADGSFNAYDSERSEEHTSELQSLMRTSYAVFCWNTKTANRY